MKTNIFFKLAVILIFGFFIQLSNQNLFAQSPESLNYQAVVRDASGVVIANQLVNFRMSILEGSASGNEVFSETHLFTTNTFGLANLMIGKGNVLRGAFNSINWGGNSHYLKVEFDPSGGIDFILMGTTQLLSVPYALHAKTVENDMVNDADSDPSNEIQIISLNGSELTLSENGGTVTLPTGAISQWTANGNSIYNKNTGYVGIGTQAPYSRLTLGGTGSELSFRDAESGAESYISFRKGGNDLLAMLGYYGNDASLSLSNKTIGGDILINTMDKIDFQSSGLTKMTMTSSGNVGIGTTNPDAKLDVIGKVKITDGSQGAGKVLTSSSTGLATWQTPYTGADNPWTVSGNSIYNKNTGNVGIGTIYPAAKLAFGDLGADIRFEEGLGSEIQWMTGRNTLEASVGFDGSEFKISNGHTGGNVTVFSSGQINLRAYSGQTMTCYVGGNVGIRKYYPECELHVKQTGTGFANGLRLERHDNLEWWSIQTNYNSDLVLDYNGTNTRAWLDKTSAGFHNISDRRLKQDIETIETVLNKVMQLKPVTYRFKSDPDAEKLSYGLIAQDVERIFPEFVSENNGYLGVAYHNFGVISIRAIQEQQEIIENQQAQIDQLREENSSLRAEMETRLSRIEAAVNLAGSK